MKQNRSFSILILCANLFGLICLVWFAVPYLTHNTQVLYPDVMLPAERWDLAGFALTVGAIPLFIVNFLGFRSVRAGKSGAKFLFFLPSVICIVMSMHYWLISLI